ncbi:MAG TPA: FtsX-like permease family protein, partial [Puia sp.]|nr:FtsX-like permease family protein [Puia sp.]
NANIKNTGLMLSRYSLTISTKNNNEVVKRFKEDKNIALVSDNWFRMFDYKFLRGDDNQLKFPNTAVITKTEAIRYFGNEDPIGKALYFPNDVPVKIVGIISDEPYNSDIKSGMYVSLSSLKNIDPGIEDNFLTDWAWISDNTSVFLTLNEKQPKALIESQINELAKAHLGNNAKYYTFFLQPLTNVHFDSNYGGSIQRSTLITLMIIGFCILIIATFNYVNLSIAQQAKRMIEIGTRKVLGATPSKLFIQFIIETSLTIFISITIAVIAIAALFPAVNHSLFSQDPIDLVSYKNIIAFIIILAVALVFLSGLYPAIVLSRIPVFNAFKNITDSWKAGMLRKVLTVAQNAVACMLIICTIVMVMQVHFLKHTQIGFNSNSVVMLPLPDTTAAKENLMRYKLAVIPQVKSYSFCHAAPSSEMNWGGSVKYDNRDWEQWPGRSEIGDSSYVKTFGLHLIAGRNIRSSSASSEFLINEKMVNKLGLKNPDDVIGKHFVIGEFGDKQGIIVGVVNDFNTQSLLLPIEPVVIADEPEKYGSVAVRLTGNDMQVTMANIRKNWEAVFQNDVFEYHFTDDQIAALYVKQDLQQKLVWFSATVAIITSCLGLLGLVSLVTLQRTKEIGIRKVLGASVPGIVQLISRDFLSLVIIAIIIAVPCGWLIMNKWLQGFAYHIHISWWVFIVAGLSAIIIAFLSICFQTIKAAMANPVKSLKTE